MVRVNSEQKMAETYEPRDFYADEINLLGRVRLALREFGWCRIRGLSSKEAEEQLFEKLGPIIRRDEVRPNSESPNLVRSKKEIPPHTDHHRARYIGWYCKVQAVSGGETLLVDGRAAYDQLEDAEKRILQKIILREHMVFPDDEHGHPLALERDGEVYIYYASFLVPDNLSKEEEMAIRAFEAALERAPRWSFRLEPGDTLIVDNSRILHARTSFQDDERSLLRFWIGEVKGTVANSISFEWPRISEERIRFLIERGVDPEVAKIDLEMVKRKLQDSREGLGWSIEQCEDGELEYKRFLTLCLRYGKCVPTSTIDKVWHAHLLDTRAYHRDCQRVFGGYFHHFPYLGMRGADDEQRLADAFARTQALYEREFGEPMVRPGVANCWHDCEGRCWHACAEKDLSS